MLSADIAPVCFYRAPSTLPGFCSLLNAQIMTNGAFCPPSAQPIFHHPFPCHQHLSVAAAPNLVNAWQIRSFPGHPSAIALAGGCVCCCSRFRTFESSAPPVGLSILCRFAGHAPHNPLGGPGLDAATNCPYFAPTGCAPATVHAVSMLTTSLQAGKVCHEQVRVPGRCTCDALAWFQMLKLVDHSVCACRVPDDAYEILSVCTYACTCNPQWL